MKNNNIKERIKEHFFVNPTSKLRLREIEKTLKIPFPSTTRYCKELVKEGILQTQTIGSVKFYTSNRTNEDYILEKKLYNIKKLYKSDLINHLKKEMSDPPIILFGSYSKGEDTEESDIDLYIETRSKKELKLKKFEAGLKRKIQIFRYKNIKDIKNTNLANNIINGIVLNNFIEVFK